MFIIVPSNLSIYYKVYCECKCIAADNTKLTNNIKNLSVKLKIFVITTSVIAICKNWHVLQRNTCQYVYNVLACIVVCIGGMY